MSLVIIDSSQNRVSNESSGEQSEEVVESMGPTAPSQQQMLVTRVLQGEPEAFNDIVAQYGSLMQHTAYMIVGDRDIAEDVVQDALIQVWHHLPKLREAGALRSWLMRIVVNQCISFKRRVARSAAFKRQSLSEQEIEITARIADDYKGYMERNWDLAEAINNLPTRQRIAVVLHYYHGMTLSEMARALQTSENTLKKRIQAALVKLRHTLYVNDLDDICTSHSPKASTRRPRLVIAPA